jgi:hypothetical protein
LRRALPKSITRDLGDWEWKIFSSLTAARAAAFEYLDPLEHLPPGVGGTSLCLAIKAIDLEADVHEGRRPCSHSIATAQAHNS